MLETDRLSDDNDWIDLEVLEREATPESAMKLGIQLHLAGVSLSDTATILGKLGANRIERPSTCG